MRLASRSTLLRVQQNGSCIIKTFYSVETLFSPRGTFAYNNFTHRTHSQILFFNSIATCNTTPTNTARRR